MTEVFAEGVKAATPSPVIRRSSRSSRASQDINYNEDCQEFSSSKHPHKKGTQRKPSSPTTKENASPSEPSSSHSSKKRRVISWSDSSADESRSPKRSERTSKDSSPDPPSSKKLNRSKKKRRGPPSESSPNKESRDEPEKKDTRDSNLQSKSDTKKTSKGIKKLSKDESLLKEKDASRKKSNSSDKHQHPSKKNSAKVRLKTKNIPEGDPRQKKTPQKTISSRASKTKTTPKPKVQKNFVLGDLDDSDSFDDEPVHKTPVKGKKSPGSGRRRRLDPGAEIAFTLLDICYGHFCYLTLLSIDFRRASSHFSAKK